MSRADAKEERLSSVPLNCGRLADRRRDEFLAQASGSIGMEDNADAPPLPDPTTRPSRAQVEAAIHENYGEFP